MNRSLAAFPLLAAAASLAACGDPQQPRPIAAAEEVAAFLAERDPPEDVEIERKVDLDSAADAVARSPAERSANLLETMMRRGG